MSDNDLEPQKDRHEDEDRRRRDDEDRLQEVGVEDSFPASDPPSSNEFE